MVRPLLAVAALLLVALSGCLGDAEPLDPPLSGDDPLGSTDGNSTGNATDNATFGPGSVLEAPTWTVGTWWGHHIFDRDGTPSGQHHNVAVVDDQDGYQTATKHETMALRDAQEDLPTLGAISSTLGTTNGGEAFFWYDWPLAVNDTWTQTFTVGNASYDLTFSVDYSAQIPTALGKLPGFTITGATETDVVLLYDYVPELAWFAELRVFDPASDAPDEPEYRIMNMGHGTDYSDEWRTYAITPLLTWTYGYDVLATEAPDPGLEADFEVTEGTAKLYGPASVTADNGQVTLRLTAPSGDEYDLEVGAPGGTEQKVFDVSDPEVGLWTARAIGAGTLVAVDLHLDGLEETKGTVTPATN